MSSQALRAYLVRHGEVNANTEMRYLGSRDDALNVRGQAQAKALAAAAGLPPEHDFRLSEMSSGDWEGLTRNEVMARGPADAALLDLPLTATRRIFLDPATISVVDWGPRPIVRLINSHEHLGWPNARWLGSS